MSSSGVDLSIIIPVCNEAVTLANLLRSFGDQQLAEDVEVIVVVNGSSDNSLDVARGFEWARVINQTDASKTRALNRGDLEARGGNRIYLDADITLGPGSLEAVRRAMQQHSSSARCFAPVFSVDSSRSSLLVRLNYEFWKHTPYREAPAIGSGFIAVNALARNRFAEFPDVIADDLFVQSLFSLDEVVVVDAARFSVRAPRKLSALIRRNARVRAGNVQLATRGLASVGTRSTVLHLFGVLKKQPSLLPAGISYFCTTAIVYLLAARLRRTSSAIPWYSDRSTRG